MGAAQRPLSPYLTPRIRIPNNHAIPQNGTEAIFEAAIDSIAKSRCTMSQYLQHFRG